MIFSPRVLDKLERVILAQWVPLPVRRQEPSTQIGVVIEAHSKKIEDFAFEPVRSGPNTCHTVDTIFHSGFQPHALVRPNRKQVVDHLKRRGCARPVYARQIREIVEASFFITPQVIADLNNASAIDIDRKLPDKLNRVTNRITELRFQFFDEWVIRRVSRLWSFVFFLDWRFRRTGRSSLVCRE